LSPPGARRLAPPAGQNRGRFPGMPTRRGNRSGQGYCWIRIWYAVGLTIRSRLASPSWARPSESQRSGRPPGGSATIRRPPVRRNGAPHSAVAAGEPKLRATTRSNPPRSGPRPAVSARSPTTSTRPASPSWTTASLRNSIRVRLPSRRTQVVSGSASASGSPGRPPPLPRSRARQGAGARAGERSRARSMCAVAGPGPRNPRR
jgi:hypothetical protein